MIKLFMPNYFETRDAVQNHGKSFHPTRKVYVYSDLQARDMVLASDTLPSHDNYVS